MCVVDCYSDRRCHSNTHTHTFQMENCNCCEKAANGWAREPWKCVEIKFHSFHSHHICSNNLVYFCVCRTCAVCTGLVLSGVRQPCQRNEDGMNGPMVSTQNEFERRLQWMLPYILCGITSTNTIDTSCQLKAVIRPTNKSLAKGSKRNIEAFVQCILTCPKQTCYTEHLKFFDVRAKENTFWSPYGEKKI